MKPSPVGYIIIFLTTEYFQASSAVQLLRLSTGFAQMPFCQVLCLFVRFCVVCFCVFVVVVVVLYFLSGQWSL